MAGNEVTITVTGRDRTGSLFSGVATKASTAFAQVRTSIRTHMDGAVKDADSSGKSIGSRLLSSVGDGLKTAAGAVTEGLSSALSTASSAAGPVLTAAMVGAGAAAGLAGGAALGGALVLGLGAGFVGIGAMVLLQNEKIKAEFTKTGDEIKKIMADAAKPLLPVFRDAMDGVKSLVKEFNPIFKNVFKDAQGPLKDFIRSLLDGVKELKPAVEPIMSAFTGLLDEIGPQLKGVFKDVAGSLKDLAGTVESNKTLISGLFVLLLKSIPAVIDGVTWVVNAFRTVGSTVDGIQTAISKVFVSATEVVLGFAEKVLGVFRTIAEAIGNIPGMEEFSRKMVEGLDTAIGKVQEWKSEAQDLGREVELRANIRDLTMKIDEARAKLDDPDLTKERRAEIAANIDQLVAAKTKAVLELGDPKLVKEYKSNITAEIATLQSRLATARKELKDPDLTKERKATLNAKIDALEAQVAAAKRALASIPNKTVTVTVRTVGDTSIYRAGSVTASTRARGGIIGAAGGGPRSAMTLVGEQGPELVKLPFGSTVIPNGQSESMLGQGGGGGGVTVNLYVQGSIRSDRDLVSLIRDEFLNGGFRGATT